MATREEVELFLKTLRDKIQFSYIAYRPRTVNLDAVFGLDIIPAARTEYIKKLTVENYFSGPNKDTHDTTKPDYYEFGINIKGTEVYIKLSIGLPNKPIDCMSFHKAARTITYPFKT